LYDLIHNETLILEGEMILNILRDISQGLRFLHSAAPPLIHGDLKAQNVLVDRRFRAKVSDFILSNEVNAGLHRGSLYWKAPELLRQETQASPRTDIYSFGMVMYEVYSRCDPYDGEDFEVVIPQIIDRKINLRPTIPSSCSAPIQGLILDCLHEEAEQRPSSEELDIRLKRC
jgi:serine/threonine protein kinase